jgi:hypothetical protein
MNLAVLAALRARLLLICLGILPAVSLPARHFAFRSYGQSDGLGNLVVHCLLQDRAGFIWVGTQSGLYRYEGRRFAAFRRERGPPAARIEAIHETAAGVLWAGTRQGLARWNGERFEAVDMRFATEILGPSGLAPDQRGNLYVGTANGLAVGRPAAGSPMPAFHHFPNSDSHQPKVYGVHLAPGEVLSAHWNAGRQTETHFRTIPASRRFHHTPVRGTGLGLSICPQLASLMGGDICVDSVPVTEARSASALYSKPPPLRPPPGTWPWPRWLMPSRAGLSTYWWRKITKSIIGWHGRFSSGEATTWSLSPTGRTRSRPWSVAVLTQS